MSGSALNIDNCNFVFCVGSEAAVVSVYMLCALTCITSILLYLYSYLRRPNLRISVCLQFRVLLMVQRRMAKLRRPARCVHYSDDALPQRVIAPWCPPMRCLLARM